MLRAWFLVLLVGCRAGYEAPGIGDLEIPPNCGDGVLDADEECDDGNRDGTDRCTLACTIARCGDRFVRPVLEQCDDGDRDDGDDCSNSCVRCDDDRSFFAGDACTIAVGNRVPGSQVDDACSGLEAQPASYASGRDHDAAIAALELGVPHYFGMNYTGSGGWGWQDDRIETTFGRWGVGQPAVSDTSTRALVAADGTWSTTSEGEDHPVLCTRRIDPRWEVRDDGRAYRAVSSGSHVEQIGQCQGLGPHARLAILPTLDDLAFVGVFGFSSSVWVDARGVGMEYTWSDGTPVDPALWDADEPDIADGCVAVSSSGLLDSQDCANGHSGLCELL